MSDGSAGTRQYYQLAPGVDVVPLHGGDLLFRSEQVRIRLEGESARWFGEKAVPLLDGRHDVEALVSAMPGIRRESLVSHLEQLTQAAVLVCEARGPDAAPSRETRAVGLGTTDGSLANKSVAVFGLEGPGSHLASMLVSQGVGELLLVDPFVCEPGDVPHMIPGCAAGVGSPREVVVQDLLQLGGGGTRLRISSPHRRGEAVDLVERGRTRVRELAEGHDLLISCFDRGFQSMHHWVNAAAFAHDVPCLFAEVTASGAWLGPLVRPNENACFLCYRMRRVACEPSFDEAMAYEEALDQQKAPRFRDRGIASWWSPVVAGWLVAEASRVLQFGSPTLGGAVLELDSATLQTRRHPVLQQPDCPNCGPLKKKPRAHPELKELLALSPGPRTLVDLHDELVSPVTGVVRQVVFIDKGPFEPIAPRVGQASLANHRMIPRAQYIPPVCGGKGFDQDALLSSTLGESVERYSSAFEASAAPVVASRSQLQGRSLDPNDLVLFRPEQYQHLPYVPYRDDSVLRWVPGRSLVHDDQVWVPEVAASLSERTHTPDENLRLNTSNGIATGPTLGSAVLRAILEVLERDAFVITWLNRLPVLRLDGSTHPDEKIRHLVEAYRRRSVTMNVFELPVDHPATVCMAIALEDVPSGGPAAMVGLGCALTRREAAAGAVVEVAQIRPGFRIRMRNEEVQRRIQHVVQNPEDVVDLEDHAFVYFQQQNLRAFDFLMESPPGTEPFEEEEAKEGPALEQLIQHFRSREQDALYVNLTPPDMEAMGLFTARAILPGFQPIHFGYQQRALGGRRLYDLPVRLGLRDEPLTPETLNPDPHPLA